jgi:hypothetical protein
MKQITEQQIREHLIKSGVKNLQEFGYPHVTEANILTDEVYKEFFKSMLNDNLGVKPEVDKVIQALLTKLEAEQEVSND